MNNTQDQSDDAILDTETAIRLHDKIIGQQESSTLHIQNYSLLKYIQKPEEIIAIESYSQGSIRFVLPKGRNVLRLELAARNGINPCCSLVNSFITSMITAELKS